MTCVACQEPRSRHKVRKGQVDIVECTRCGLAWWVPEPGFDPRATYDAAYFDSPRHEHGYDDYSALGECLRRTFAARISRLPPAKKDTRLLDVGAAYGFAVEEARRVGWEAFGLEVSEAAARSARGEAAGRMVVGPAEAIPFASASFDAITAWDVLEHLSRPRESLREIHRLLKPGGRFVLTTGDVGSWLARISGRKWHLYTLPEHLYFFTQRSLELLLDSEGFETEAIRSERAYYTVGYLVERLRKTLLGREAADGTGWPGSKLTIPVKLFDIMHVEARKR